MKSTLSLIFGAVLMASGSMAHAVGTSANEPAKPDVQVVKVLFMPASSTNVTQAPKAGTPPPGGTQQPPPGGTQQPPPGGTTTNNAQPTPGGTSTNNPTKPGGTTTNVTQTPPPPGSSTGTTQPTNVGDKPRFSLEMSLQNLGKAAASAGWSYELWINPVGPSSSTQAPRQLKKSAAQAELAAGASLVAKETDLEGPPLSQDLGWVFYLKFFDITGKNVGVSAPFAVLSPNSMTQGGSPFRALSPGERVDTLKGGSSQTDASGEPDVLDDDFEGSDVEPFVEISSIKVNKSGVAIIKGSAEASTDGATIKTVQFYTGETDADEATYKKATITAKRQKGALVRFQIRLKIKEDTVLNVRATDSDGADSDVEPVDVLFGVSGEQAVTEE